MLERERKRLREKLREIREEVGSYGGPTVPPSGMARREMLRRVGRADAYLDELDALIGGVDRPRYTPTPPAVETPKTPKRKKKEEKNADPN